MGISNIWVFHRNQTEQQHQARSNSSRMLALLEET